MEKINDFAPLLIGGLSLQFQRKERIEALLRHVVAPQLQALEDVFFTMLGAFDLDAAPSDLLDKLGGIVGQRRAPGESDALYLRKIRARQVLNRSRGRIEDLNAIARLLFADKLLDVRVWEVAPMEMVLALQVSLALTAGEEALAVEFLLAGKVGGVAVDGMAWYTTPAFAWGNGADGWDDGSETVGAYWAKYFYP